MSKNRLKASSLHFSFNSLREGGWEDRGRERWRGREEGKGGKEEEYGREEGKEEMDKERVRGEGEREKICELIFCPTVCPLLCAGLT